MILDISGSLELEILKDGKQIDAQEEQKVINKLNNGSLLLGLVSQTITDFEFKTIYTFNIIDVLSHTEYNFE